MVKGVRFSGFTRPGRSTAQRTSGAISPGRELQCVRGSSKFIGTLGPGPFKCRSGTVNPDEAGSRKGGGGLETSELEKARQVKGRGESWPYPSESCSFEQVHNGWGRPSSIGRASKPGAGQTQADQTDLTDVGLRASPAHHRSQVTIPEENIFGGNAIRFYGLKEFTNGLTA